MKVKSVAFISYGPGTPGSYPACHALRERAEQCRLPCQLLRSHAQVGGTYSSEVQRIRNNVAINLSARLHDPSLSDDITFAPDMQQYGLKIKQEWLEWGTTKHSSVSTRG